MNPCAALLRFRPGKAKFREARPVAAHVNQPGSVRRSPHGDRRDALHNADRREETACERAGRRLHLLRRVPARAIRTGGIPARPLQRGVIILAAIPVLEDNRALGPAPGAVGKGSRTAGAVLRGDFQLGNQLLPPGDPRFHKAAVVLLVAVRREQRAVRQTAHNGVELEIRVLAVAEHDAERVGPLAQQAGYVTGDIVDGARRVTLAGIEQRVGERRAIAAKHGTAPGRSHRDARDPSPRATIQNRRQTAARRRDRPPSCLPGQSKRLPSPPETAPSPRRRAHSSRSHGRRRPTPVPSTSSGCGLPAPCRRTPKPETAPVCRTPESHRSPSPSRELLRRGSRKNPAGALQRRLPPFPPPDRTRR